LARTRVSGNVRVRFTGRVRVGISGLLLCRALSLYATCLRASV